MSTFFEQLKQNKLQIPKSALKITVGTELVADKQEKQESGVKVHIKARAKEPINHFFWGKIAHDFSTMNHKPRIAIDDSHMTEIGYSKSIGITQYGLEIDGIVIKNKECEDHPANRVAFNLENGIPQEASIDFSGDYNIEVVEEGQIKEVNGLQLEGPAVVIKDWTLRAVAICKSGADVNTETTITEFKEADIKNPLNIQNLQTKVDDGNVQKLTEVASTETKLTDETVTASVEQVKDEVKQEVIEKIPETLCQENKVVEEVKPEVIKTDEGKSEIEMLKSKIIEVETKLTKATEIMNQLEEVNKSLLAKNEELNTKLSSVKLGTEAVQVSSNKEVKTYKNWCEFVYDVQQQYNIANYADAFAKAKELDSKLYDKLSKIGK